MIFLERIRVPMPAARMTAARFIVRFSINSLTLGDTRYIHMIKANHTGNIMNWTDFTVVFDLDGTLVDTAPDLHAALVHCFSEKGLPAVTLDTIRHAIGHGARVMIETCAKETGASLTEDELSAMHKSFLSYYIAHIADFSRPFSGITETLDYLRDKGARLSVCTNKTQDLAEEVLQTLNLTDYFDSVIGADKASEKKPSPAHLLEAVSAAGGIASHSVLIGDSSTDGRSAEAAGIPFILMTYGYLDDAAYDPKRFGQLSDANELPGLLESMVS